MNVRQLSLSTLAFVVVAAGCSEPAPVPTEAPLLSVSGGTACSFDAMPSVAVKFFTDAAQLTTVKHAWQGMRAAWAEADSAPTRDFGYDMLAEIASAVESGEVGVVSAGSDLTNLVSACMLFTAEQLPADFPHDYTTELTPSAAGAFAVRGGSADAADAVLARGALPISGLGPQTTSSWTESLEGVVPTSRALFYGRPVDDVYSYEWKAIPANAAFEPAVIVGLCDPGNTYLVYEAGSSILAYADAYFLSGPCPTNMGSLSGWQRALALVERVGSHLLPSRLEAAPVSPGGLGGLGKGFSVFTTYEVTTVTPAFLAQPGDAKVLPGKKCPTTPIGHPYNIGPVQFAVTTDGIPVAGVLVSITAINNNGTPAELCGNTTGVTDADGIVTLDGIGVTKTGGYLLVAKGKVAGRDIGSVPTRSERFHIRP
jgi:hypothetical protein